MEEQLREAQVLLAQQQRQIEELEERLRQRPQEQPPQVAARPVARGRMEEQQDKAGGGEVVQAQAAQACLAEHLACSLSAAPHQVRERRLAEGGHAAAHEL